MKTAAFGILSADQLNDWFRDAKQIFQNFGFNLFTLFVLAIVAGVVRFIYSFVRDYKKRAARRAELENFARQNGWTYAKRGKVDRFPNWRHYKILEFSTVEVNGFLTRVYDEGTVYLFDYTYRYRSGNARIHRSQTIIGFYTPHLNVPYFALAEETIGTQIGKFLGYQDINFAAHPKFSEKYNLSGTDEAAIRQTFDARVLSYLEALPNVQVDAGGNLMFVYLHSRVIPVGDLNAFCDMAIEIYKLFRR